ncbi:hypothetical protein ACP4OV_019296 [Aristida adscensionis]
MVKPIEDSPRHVSCSRGRDPTDRIQRIRASEYSALQGVPSDELRETSHVRGFLDPSCRIGLEQSKKNHPCKFYARNQCRNGQNCRYLHDSGHVQHSQMGLGPPIAMPNWEPVHDIAPPNHMRLSGPATMQMGPLTFHRNHWENPDWPFNYSGCQQAVHQIHAAPTLGEIHGAPSSWDGFKKLEHCEMNPYNGLSSVPTVNSVHLAPYAADFTAWENMELGLCEMSPGLPSLPTGNFSEPLAPHTVNFTARQNMDPRFQSQAVHQVQRPIQQEVGIIKTEPFVSFGRQVAHMSSLETGTRGGNHETLAHMASLTGHAGNVGDNPSEENKKEPRGIEGGAKENDNGKKNIAQKMFKVALVNFVKQELKPTWDEGNLKKDLYKVIVQKVVEKIISSEKSTPETNKKIDNYLRLSKKKIINLIQNYLDKFTDVKLQPPQSDLP